MQNLLQHDEPAKDIQADENDDTEAAPVTKPIKPNKDAKDIAKEMISKPVKTYKPCPCCKSKSYSSKTKDRLCIKAEMEMVAMVLTRIMVTETRDTSPAMEIRKPDMEILILMAILPGEEVAWWFKSNMDDRKISAIIHLREISRQLSMLL